MKVYGRELTRAALAARGMGHWGIELLAFADGPERGVRVLEMRNGAGLSLRIAVDRGFDLLLADYRGLQIGWRSPTGPRHPGLASVEEGSGWGFLRSFTGLLATCGLDHALGPGSSSAERYIYPGFERVDYNLHGRVSQIPARLTAYGERWNEAGSEGVLFAEGVVEQAAVFGEVLTLTRRVELPIGGERIEVVDRVENRGFRPTPHMMLYHYNFGYPLLDAGAELVLPAQAIVHKMHEPQAQGVGFRHQGPPVDDFREQVYQHDVASDGAGMGSAALVNTALGQGVLVEWDRAALPCLIQWQCLQSGLYTLGIEPSSNHVLGRGFAEERAELIELSAGESRTYRTRLTVLDGEAAISDYRSAAAKLAPPLEDFADATGDWPKLR
jgi:hypothetical protein